MSRVFAVVLLAMLSLLARADDTANPHEIKFAFKERGAISSLIGDDGPSAYVPPYEAPEGAHGREAGYLMLNYHREQAWELRDQLFESLGVARLIPQGRFTAGGINTRWHFSVPNDDTVEFKFFARF